MLGEEGQHCLGDARKKANTAYGMLGEEGQHYLGDAWKMATLLRGCSEEGQHYLGRHYLGHAGKKPLSVHDYLRVFRGGSTYIPKKKN